MAIDSCLRPDPAARPTIRELAAALDATPPWQRRRISPSSAGRRDESWSEGLITFAPSCC
ncbi:hypothetical protein [Streptomyces sp. NPDC059970]|uniref:hypothetical protein n=1 Tax=Streptomyces sp. NPDC059970 TaxID=3347019 RepID=UPI0036B2C62E